MGVFGIGIPVLTLCAGSARSGRLGVSDLYSLQTLISRNVRRSSDSEI